MKFLLHLLMPLLLLGGTLGSASVLCIGPGGRWAIEPLGARCCGQPWESGRGVDLRSHPACASGCSDIPLLRTAAALRSSDDVGRSISPVPRLLVGVLGGDRQGWLASWLQALPGPLPPLDPRELRTTVNRC